MCLAPLTYFQRSLIYHPRHSPRLLGNKSGLPQATVDVTVMASDGLELHGWLALAGIRLNSQTVDAKQALADGRPVILFFPGNAGDRSMRTLQMGTLGALKAHVLLFDYRGYADNPGKPTEEDFADDARVIWNHLVQEFAVPADRVIIYGESLGGGTATRLASELCHQGIEPGGLIVQSTFSSLTAVAQLRFPILPVSWILVDRFPSELRIRNVTCPILQIHGKRDSIVPFTIGQQLFDAAPAKSSGGVAKRQLAMPDTDHNDVYDPNIGSPDHSALMTELRNFLDLVASRPATESNAVKETLAPSQRSSIGIFHSIDRTLITSVVIVLMALSIWWFCLKNPQAQPPKRIPSTKPNAV